MTVRVEQSREIPPPFSLSRLRYILRRIVELGYRVARFEEVTPALLEEDAVVLLRHDIDLSLERALRVAELEADMGLRATYFVRVHSPFYSPLSQEGARRVRTIASLGHTIGLHYDSAFLDSLGPEGGARMFRLDVDLLETVLGRPVRSVSAHDPATAGIPSWLPHGEYVDAYSEPFTRRMRYLSDSSRSWREGCFSQHVERLGRYQVLIHPVWWCSEQPALRGVLTELGDQEADATRRRYLELADQTERHLRERAQLDRAFSATRAVGA